MSTTAIFEKPADDERQHLKALFVKGRVDGQPMSNILIDGGAGINIMLYAVYRKLGKGDQDLTQIDMMVKDFEGNVSPVKGVICVELTICSKTLPTTFFVTRLRLSREILLMLSHRQRQTPTKELGVFQEKFGKRIFSKLPIMKFHRSKQSVLMKVFNG